MKHKFKSIAMIFSIIAAVVGCCVVFWGHPLAYVTVAGMVIFLAIAKFPQKVESSKKEMKPISLNEIMEYDTIEDENVEK